MAKLFHRNGKISYNEDAYTEGETYEGEGFDWDESGEYENEEYESEEYESELYENEYSEDVENQYAEESIEENDGAEYHSEEYSGEEEYSGGEEYYEDEYSEEEYYEDDLYYIDEENEEENYEKGNFFINAWNRFTGMNALDKIVSVTGTVVIILAIVTAGVYISAASIDKQLNELADVGSSLADVEVPGEKGLMAVADAKVADLAAARLALEQELVNEEFGGYDEQDYNKNVTVSLEMVSVYRDLKIKFNNKESGKLVYNVPFSVTVTKPDGKSETWSDDDMDGIIYKKDITPGKYSVSINELAGEKYADYTIPTAAKSVEVKKDIEYKKVNVKNEIKKESEINAAKEDTAKKNTAVESVLEDTVAFVESSSVTATYREVPKSSITDPMTLVKSGGFVRLSGGGVPTPATATEPPATATEPSATATEPPATATETSAPATENPGLPTSSPTTTTPETTPSPEVTALPTVSPAVSPTVAPTPTVSPSVTPALNKTIKLDVTTATVYVSETKVISATLGGASENKVKAESSNTGVATVSISGNAVTVTAKAPGSATITISHPNDSSVKATCAITVKSNPKLDKSTKLKDNSGNQLFVYENGTYREAVYADYYTFSNFYMKGEVKYTGWQTLDGKLYYFTADGEKVTGEQVIQGAKYTFASDGSVVAGSQSMGIDVSKWNGSIDWNAVKNSGVSYVIIRCGYRGSTQGALIDDPKFAANIKGATAAGLKVGVYFFTQAIDEVEAVQEASMVLDRVKGYKISYPIFLDVESSGGRGDKISTETRTAVCKAFCATIQNAGYSAGVYANKTWFTSKINTSELGGYKIWLAQYAASPTYNGRYDLWQYKSTGKVSGIKGNVDMNISYLGY